MGIGRNINVSTLPHVVSPQSTSSSSPGDSRPRPTPTSSIPSYHSDIYPVKDSPVPQQQQQQERQDQYDDVSASASNNQDVIVEQQSQTAVPVSNTDMNTLLKHIERREWMQVVKFFERYPHAPRQKAQGSGNLPLHEALKHSPPLPVVNLLLEMHEGALRTPGAHGCLPLHVACSCRHIGVDVVTRLVVGHAGALRSREPTKDCLPLHLAVQTGVSEDVLMELLTNYPEASFVQDNSGKIPMDYAQVHHHNRHIVALETAPILLAAAQAAQTRVSRELEFKMNGLRDAHKEYLRQLEERFEEERTGFLQEQLQFSEDLTNEKERNISLAEMLLEVKASEKSLTKQRDGLQKQLDKEMKNFRTLIETQEAELRLVLDEADVPDAAVSDRALPGEEHVQSKSLKDILRSVTKGLNDTKAETATLKSGLGKQEAMVHHLNELLTAKDEEIAELKQNLVRVESSYESAAERVDELSEMHKTAVTDLNQTKEELNELKLISHENQNQLEMYKRTVRVQNSRLGTVKTMVSSLSFNLESWEEESRKEEERANSSTFCPSSLGDEVDLSHDSENVMSGTTVLVRKLDEGEEEEWKKNVYDNESEFSKKLEEGASEASGEVEQAKMGEESLSSDSTVADSTEEVVVVAASAHEDQVDTRRMEV
ncbi:MAG: hypothetical protein SGILL_001882 [Bacillariaceae sp.]